MLATTPDAAVLFELDGQAQAATGSGEFEQRTAGREAWEAVWQGAGLLETDGTPGDNAGPVTMKPLFEADEEERSRRALLAALIPAVSSTLEPPSAELNLGLAPEQSGFLVHPETIAESTRSPGSGGRSLESPETPVNGMNPGVAGAPAFEPQEPELPGTLHRDSGGQESGLSEPATNSFEDVLASGAPVLKEAGSEPALGRPAELVADVVLRPDAGFRPVRPSQTPSPANAGIGRGTPEVHGSQVPQAPNHEAVGMSSEPAAAGWRGDLHRGRTATSPYVAPVESRSSAAIQQERIELATLPDGAEDPAKRSDLHQAQREPSPQVSPLNHNEGGRTPDLPAQTPSADAGSGSPMAASFPAPPSREAGLGHPSAESRDKTEIRTEAGSEAVAGAEPEPPAGRLQNQLDLQLDGRAGERVRIRLAEAPGGVRLRVASNDARLAETLRAEWRSLEAALREAGWQMQPKESGMADAAREGWRWTQGQTAAKWAADGGAGNRTIEPSNALNRGWGSPEDSSPRQHRQDRQDRESGAREELADLSAIRRLGRRRQS
jgi:hypothetical protein